MEQIKTIHWNPTMALADLQNVAVSGECVVLELPDDQRVLVTPSDGFDTLKLVLNSPVFVETLTQSLQDVTEGRVEPFDEEMLEKELKALED